MGMKGLKKFCTISKIRDKSINPTVLSTYFSAANYEEVDDEANPDN